MQYLFLEKIHFEFILQNKISIYFLVLNAMKMVIIVDKISLLKKIK